jgi:RNA polymerase sigma factor (sigma-70 family)
MKCEHQDTSREGLREAHELQELLCPHVPRLVRYVRSLMPADVSAAIDAEDIVQDAMIDGLCSDSPLAFDSPDHVWRWIALIARHTMINRIAALRARKRGGGHRRVEEGEDRYGNVVGLLSDLAVHHRTPSRSVARREVVLILKSSLDQMPPHYRDALHARYIDGLSFKDAADRIGGTEESTRKLCVRALGVLREKLHSATRFL